MKHIIIRKFLHLEVSLDYQMPLVVQRTFGRVCEFLGVDNGS